MTGFIKEKVKYSCLTGMLWHFINQTIYIMKQKLLFVISIAGSLFSNAQTTVNYGVTGGIWLGYGHIYNQMNMSTDYIIKNLSYNEWPLQKVGDYLFNYLEKRSPYKRISPKLSSK